MSATDGSGALMSKYYNRNFKEYIWNRNIYYYYTDKIKEIEKREKEINDELKWQGMVNRGAVSYTHLDVYKRQDEGEAKRLHLAHYQLYL